MIVGAVQCKGNACAKVHMTRGQLFPRFLQEDKEMGFTDC